jgi:hypothetical protein
MDALETMKRWALNLFYRKKEFATTSAGAANAYQPAILNSLGYFDPSLINGNLDIDTLFANGPSIVNGGGKGVYVSGPTTDGVRFISGAVGFNVRWNGTNYIVGTDGGSNGGTLLLAAGTGETWQVYSFPSTGVAVQTIAPASLATYFQFQVSSLGAFAAAALGVGIASPTATLDVSRGTLGAGTAAFRGTNAASHFNYGAGEETYLRAGKTGATIYLQDGHNGAVDIGAGGGDVFLGSGGGRTTAAGAVGIAWAAVTFGTGWGNFGGGYQNGQVKRFGDWVITRGLITRSSGVGTTLFTYPVNSRPPATILCAVLTDTGLGRVDITTGGAVIQSAGGTGWVSLNDIPPFSAVA